MTDQPAGGEAGQPDERPAHYDYLAETAAVFDMTPGSTTMLPGAPPRRRGRSLVLATTAAVALVLAGGTFTAVQLLNGSTADPAEAAPASTFAFVSVDLDPTAGQKLDIYRFTKHFPKSPTATKGDSSSVMDTLLGSIIDSADPSISYKADIKPWLGGSAAFAAYDSGHGKVTPIAILGYKDKAKAQAALDKLSADGTGGYAFLDKWVVLSTTTQDAEAAAAAAKAHPLSKSSSSYRSDVDSLKGDPVVTAWADLGKAAPALFREFGSLLGGVTGFGTASSSFSVRASRMPAAPSPACMKELRTLKPSRSTNPFAGLSLKCQAELFGGAGVGRPGRPAIPMPAPSIDPSMLPKGRFALGVSISSDVLQLEAKGFTSSTAGQVKGSADAARYIKALPAGTTVGLALGDVRPAVKAVFDTLTKSTFAGISDAIKQAETETGLKFPDDVTAVLGDAVSFSYDKKAEAFAVRTHPLDSDRAKAVLDKLAGLAADSGEPLDVQTAGRDVTVSTDADYAKAISGSGGLTGTDLFGKAVGDVPSAPQLVGFANLEQLIGDAHGDTASHLSAVGMVIDGTDSNPSIIIRVVVR